jgi:hypothetical protein
VLSGGNAGLRDQAAWLRPLYGNGLALSILLPTTVACGVTGNQKSMVQTSLRQRLGSVISATNNHGSMWGNRDPEVYGSDLYGNGLAQSFLQPTTTVACGVTGIQKSMAQTSLRQRLGSVISATNNHGSVWGNRHIVFYGSDLSTATAYSVNICITIFQKPRVKIKILEVDFSIISK